MTLRARVGPKVSDAGEPETDQITKSRCKYVLLPVWARAEAGTEHVHFCCPELLVLMLPRTVKPNAAAFFRSLKAEHDLKIDAAVSAAGRAEGSAGQRIRAAEER